MDNCRGHGLTILIIIIGTFAMFVAVILVARQNIVEQLENHKAANESFEIKMEQLREKHKQETDEFFKEMESFDIKSYQLLEKHKQETDELFKEWHAKEDVTIEDIIEFFNKRLGKVRKRQREEWKELVDKRMEYLEEEIEDLDKEIQTDK